MARRRRRLLVEGAGPEMDRFKAEVMRANGYAVNPVRPDAVKYEVAGRLGVPLRPGSGGELTTEQAGKVGGHIGGPMVRELIRLAQARLTTSKS